MISMPLSSVADCENEYRAAASIAKAGAKARNQIAKPDMEKCTNALVSSLMQTCASPTNTVDSLVNLAGNAGCLITGHEAQAMSLIEAQY